MRLLVDSDAFCKLGGADLLTEAAALFDSDIEGCGRLPALPYMLRRGTLPRVYGAESCKQLISTAERMAVVQDPAGPWLERLAQVTDIDPGEALLLAAAAEGNLPILSGDLRALRAMKDIDGFAPALGGRIVVLEAAILALCNRLGSDVVRERIEPIRGKDKVLGICFSSKVEAPEEGLNSYLKERRKELSPLNLWNPSVEAP